MMWTAGKKNAFESISALQKYIRRGLEMEAMITALDLAERQLGWLLNRLRVIAYEDIGPANPQLVVAVEMYTERCAAWRKKGGHEWRLALSNTILLMCRSRKSREADHIIGAALWRIINGQAPPIPDYALCVHTSRGRRMGRDYQHFRDIAAQLVPPAAPDIYEQDNYRFAAWWQRAHTGVDREATLTWSPWEPQPVPPGPDDDLPPRTPEVGSSPEADDAHLRTRAQNGTGLG